MHMQKSRAQVFPAILSRSVSTFERAETEPRVALHRVWPVRIHTLGRFSILCNDQPLTFATKTPKKPLELLKVLIALGGRSVDIGDIMEIMWQEQGCGARTVFDVTLLRLRKLLGHVNALNLSDGKLTLNDQVCWVDLWSFERTIARDNAADEPMNHTLLDLYRGRFLDRGGDAKWIVNVRDRLAAKFRRAVLKLAKADEQAERWESAAQIYRRGLEHDNLTEEFYYRLMHCELRCGQRAEALNVYRRCRDLLSINLCSKPSVELDALYRRAITT